MKDLRNMLKTWDIGKSDTLVLLENNNYKKISDIKKDEIKYY